MLSFTAVDHPRIVSGELTVTWRLWKYAHVKSGRTYAFRYGGAIAVDDVSTVRAVDVTDADAHEAGLPDVTALFDLVSSHTGATITPETVLYRVRFHYLPQAPAKPVLSLEEISQRLQRLDSASRTGPWTLATLRLIEENPGVVSRRLAPEVGLARDDFKVNVRKLKALGLTISLEVGYELSEVGQSYLDSLDEETAHQ